MLIGIVEFLGWFGAVTVLAGYILFSTGKLQNGPVYQLLNLVGGLAIAVNVAAHHAVPSLIVNGIWAIVAMVVLTKMLRARRAPCQGSTTAPAPAPAQLLAEPPTTTAVLPVIGPALRDHEHPEPEPEPAHAHPYAHGRSDRLGHDDSRSDVADAPRGLQSVTGETTAEPAPAPMTETVPVITATIALALVAAAQQGQAHHEEARDDEPRREHETSPTA